MRDSFHINMIFISAFYVLFYRQVTKENLLLMSNVELNKGGGWTPPHESADSKVIHISCS